MATHATISQAKGSSGPEVALWHQLLAARGFAVDAAEVAASTFGASTAAQTKAWQGANGLTADGVVGPMSWAKMTGETAPPVYIEAYGKKAQFGRDTIVAVWPQILAEAATSKYPLVQQLGAMGDPNLSELQITQAQGQLESNYGLAQYKNNSTDPPTFSGVINNWGAVQAGKPPCDPSQSFEASDTGANGVYTACYRKYPTPEAGAIGMVREMTIRRPTSWALMKTGDIDAWATQMHLWDPPLTKLGPGGKVPGAKQNLDPVTGVPGYFEQLPVLGNNSRAKGIYDRAFAIAQALGEPLEVARGGPWQPGDSGDGGSGGGGGGILGVNDSLAGAAVAVGLAGGGYYLYQNGTLGRWWKAAQRLVSSRR